MSNFSVGPVKRPVVFNYLNCREFLSDTVTFLISSKATSLRSLAKSAKFKNPGYIQMLIKGQRSITRKSLLQLAQALNVSKSELPFFKLLVEFDLQKSPSKKDQIFQILLTNKKFRQLRPLEAHQYEFYSKWYMPVLFAALTISYPAPSLSRIASSLGITMTELEAALETMLKLNLIHKHKSRWLPKNIGLKTAPEAHQLSLRRFHKELLKRGIEALDKETEQVRDVQSITMTLSAEDYSELKSKIHKFIMEVFEDFSQRESSENIYQLSTLLYPVLKIESQQERESKR